MNTHLRQFLFDERGATAIEYALIAALIFLVIIGAVSLMAGNVVAMFSNISTHVS